MAENNKGSKKTASKQNNKKMNNNKNNGNTVSKNKKNNSNRKNNTNNKNRNTNKNVNRNNNNRVNTKKTNTTRNKPTQNKNVVKKQDLETKVEKEVVELEKRVKETAKEKVLEDTGIVISPIEEKKTEAKEYEAIGGNTIIKEEKVDIDVTEEVQEVNVVSIEEKDKTEQLEITPEDKKHDRLIDLGILIVILGLLVLVVTSYLTTTTDISYNITNYLVLGAIGIQAIGIIIIICNMIRKK